MLAVLLLLIKQHYVKQDVLHYVGPDYNSVYVLEQQPELPQNGLPKKIVMKRVPLKQATANSAVKGIKVGTEDPIENSREDREYLIMKDINESPLFPRLYCWEKDEAELRIYMEHCDMNLRVYLKNNPRLSDDEKKACFYQVLRACEFLHDRGISHRDLKPENILIKKFSVGGACTRLPQPKVTDFGVSRVVLKEAIWHYWTVTGTEQYTAPEIRAAYDKGLTHVIIKSGDAADVFSLGAVLFEMMTGSLYYTEAKRYSDPLMAATSANISDVGVRELLCRMLHQDPTFRPSVKEVLKYFKAFARREKDDSFPSTESEGFFSSTEEEEEISEPEEEANGSNPLLDPPKHQAINCHPFKMRLAHKLPRTV